MRLARITTYKKSSVSKEPTQSMLFGFLLFGPANFDGFAGSLFTLFRGHALRAAKSTRTRHSLAIFLRAFFLHRNEGSTRIPAMQELS